MDAKEYLEQARFLDRQIYAKLDQVESLRALTVKRKALSDQNANNSGTEADELFCRIALLEQEIDADIDKLINIKIAIISQIAQLSNSSHRTILELRYLCGMPWEQISMQLGYTPHHVFKLHNNALRELEKIIK